MSGWLNRSRKATLIDLSSEAGLEIDSTLRKDEIVEALDTHLQQNASRLSRYETFEPYYQSRRTPFKARDTESIAVAATSDDSEVKSVARGRGRRSTRIKEEIVEEDEPATARRSSARVYQQIVSPPASSPIKHTPAPPRQVRRQAQLPASPADVAEDVEIASTAIYAGVGDLYTVSGIPETIDFVRESCSSVVGVNATLLLLEAYGLQGVLMPWKYAFDTPAFPFLGISSIAVKIPDLFVLLTSGFWYPTLLWSATSIFVPLLFAYFYNLTIHPVRRHGARVNVARYEYDPLTFSIVKALATLVVYGQAAPYEAMDYNTPPHVVDSAFIGGHGGVLVGCLVGGISAIWEATQRRGPL